jgi:prepilin-type N-terminal cleavage/methylation domain-containing protein
MNCMIGGRKVGRVGTRRRSAGFTIFELLVVVSIFAIGSLIITATYINFTRLHRRAANAELLGEEVRFAMELIVRAARNNRMYYVQNPYPWRADRLPLLDGDGRWIYIWRYPETDPICAGLNGDCLAMRMQGGSWTPISGKNIDVSRFNVFLTPLEDPFQPTGIGTYANDMQPRATIIMEATYRGASERESPSITVQTSVSSRVYVR